MAKEQVTQEKWKELNEKYNSDKEIMDALFEIINEDEPQFAFDHDADNIMKAVEISAATTETVLLIVQIQTKLAATSVVKEQIKILEDFYWKIKGNDNILKMMLIMLVQSKDIG
ncbi:MAG: hypothetical protein HQ541_03075 [Mariniphaga sp.]|nr:hypothetical protein [Mariniphaga sp.]